MKVYSQLISAQAENKASDYSSGTKGRVWFNTSSSLLKFDNGSAVKTLVTTDDTQTLTNKTLNTLGGVTAGHVAILAAGPNLSSEANLAISRGGTNAATAIAGFNNLCPFTTKGDQLGTNGTTAARIAVGTDGQVWTADSASTNGVKWATPSASPDQAYEIANHGLDTAIATEALTIALTQKDGSTAPSSGASAVKIGFRSTTATTGNYTQRSVTSATTVIIPKSTTIGAVSGKTEEIYVYALDNAGTVELAVSLARHDEGSVVTTAAISGGSTRTTMYSTTARSGVGFRLIGRIKAVNTSGDWTSVSEESPWFNNRNKQYSDSVFGDTPNGHGSSTGTKIRRWTNATTIGTAITYADSSTAGMTLTINEAGVYFMNYSDNRAGAVGTFGITVNSSELTTEIYNVTVGTVHAIASNSNDAAMVGACSMTARLKPGDVVRTHTDATPDGASQRYCFRIVKISD